MTRSPKSVAGAGVVAFAAIAVLALLGRGVAGDHGTSAKIGTQEARTLFYQPRQHSVFQDQSGTADPTFYYGWGYQGFGYYRIGGEQIAQMPVAVPRRGYSGKSTIGPGVRNWSTRRGSPLLRCWMRPM